VGIGFGLLNIWALSLEGGGRERQGYLDDWLRESGSRGWIRHAVLGMR
jgi:hypothetical protein